MKANDEFAGEWGFSNSSIVTPTLPVQIHRLFGGAVDVFVHSFTYHSNGGNSACVL